MAHRVGRPRRRRLSRDESRRALLDEGLRMVDEQPVGPGLDHIHPATVAANLGLTSGAIYHHWDSYDDFRDELLEELLSAGRFPAVAGYDEVFITRLSDLAGIVELIEALTEAAWREVLDDHRQLRTNLGLWARGEDDVTERLGDQYRHLAKDWAAVIETGLRRCRLEARPPFTMESIASVLAALVEGMAVRATTDPGGSTPVTTPDGERLSLFSGAALAFLTSAVRPLGDDGDLWQHARETITDPG
jgi:AcrR family transcriptional regulator